MARRSWKIAFVSPRWAPDAAGGAEVLSRLLAERLARRGHRVDALATCADDPHTWKNVRAPGEEQVGGVTVRRFPVNPGRMSKNFLDIQRRISRGHRVTRSEEEQWIEGSVVSDGLDGWLATEGGRYDALVFVPYLFGVTWSGSKIAPEKSLLLPCLHDEAFAHLSIYRDMFLRFRGFLFNSLPEMAFARRLYGVPAERSYLVSMGFDDDADYRPERFLRERGLEGPFLLYAGRREGGKNTGMLIEYFRTYRDRTGSGLKLVLIGTGDVPLKARDRGSIFDFGFVPSREKLDAMAASTAFCQPSTNESFSIVLMESWLAGRPVLVHGDCAVTRDHAERSNGGLWFDDYLTFEECLNRLIERPREAAAMAAAGRNYVLENYSWSAVLDRFEEALEVCFSVS
jgi:glycosyltransferase involved in cell wall biosynthesis